jgi:uncharacterized repeat protein (TIGR01451 family)
MNMANRALLVGVAGGMILSITAAWAQGDGPFLYPRWYERKAFQRQLHEFRQRAYPAQDLPTGSRDQAWAQWQTLVALSAPVQGNRWINIGPAPIVGGQVAPPSQVSGRVADIVADPRNPNRWLIAAAQGGIWQTLDAGVSWIPISDTQPTLAGGAIALAPSNPDIIYVGTGEATYSGSSYGGNGVLKSMDGGLTWQLLASADFNKNAFSDIQVHPSNPNVLVATVATAVSGRGGAFSATAPQPGIFKSSNGGVTWSRRQNGEGTDLEVDPRSFNTQYAGIGFPLVSPNNGVYRSSDAGDTWTRLNGPWSLLPGGVGRIELAVAPSSPDTLYVAIQDAFNGTQNDGAVLGVWRTDNATAVAPTWTQLPPFTAVGFQAWYDFEIIVDPTSPSVLYLGEVALWRFDGTAWTAIGGDYDPNVQGRKIHPDQQTMFWAGNRLLIGNDGGVYSTADGGNTYGQHNNDLAITQFYDGSLHSSNGSVALAGAQDNGTSMWRGTNGWVFTFGGDGCDNEFSTTQPDTRWVVSFQFLSIRRTIDGGASYTIAESGINFAGTPFIARFEKSPNNENIFIAGTDNLWRCNDFFTAPDPAWTANGPEMMADITAMAFAPSDTNSTTYAFGTATGSLRLTPDGGANWVNIDAANRVPGRYVTDLAFDATNANILYVTLSGFDEATPGAPGHIFKSTDALAAAPTWQNVSPVANLPFNTVAVDPFSPNIVYVGTDFGVIQSLDGGATWNAFGPTAGMPNVAVFDLQINHGTDRLVAFTHGRSAFQLVQGSTNNADVGVSLADAPDPVTSGQTLLYTALVTNLGPQTATSVTVVDNLPAGVTFLTAVGSQGSCNQVGQRIACNLGDVVAGGSATVRISVVPMAAGVLQNSVTVSANENDLNLTNNIAGASTIIGSPATDLILSASVNPASVPVGTNMAFSLNVSNAGPATAFGVALTNTLPAGFDFVSSSASQGACSRVGSVVTCFLGTLASNRVATVSITARSVVPGLFTNRASVGSIVGELNPTNNAASVTVEVFPPKPILVTAGALLDAESGPVTGGLDPGETVTMRLFLRNVGTLATSNLVASLLSTNGIVSSSPQESYGVLEAGGPPVSRPFTVTVNAGTAGVVVAHLLLEDGTNKFENLTFSFGLGSTLTVARQGIIIPDSGAGSPYPSTLVVSGLNGRVGLATLTLSNLSHTFPDDLDVLLVGPGGQKALVMSDALGPFQVSGLTLILSDNAATALPDNQAAVTGAYRPADYEAGDVLAAPAPAGPYGSALSVFRDTDPNGTWAFYIFDDFEGDRGRLDNGWLLTLSTVDPVAPEVDLAVSVVDSPDPVRVGSNITYTVTVTNAGPEAALNAVLTNRLSPGLSFVSAVSTLGACVNGGNTVVCDFGLLTNRASVTVTLVASVVTTTPQSLTATVAGSVAELLSTNNTATAITAVDAVADVGVLVADLPDPAFINGIVTYTITVTNLGPNTASGIALTNLLAPELQFLSVTQSQGSCNFSSGLLNCAVGTMAARAAATITLQAATPLTPTLLTNQFGVTSVSPVDLAPANNAATVITTNLNPNFVILPAGAVLVSESGPVTGGLDPGEMVTIDFAFRNVGPQPTAALTATLRADGGVQGPDGPQIYGILNPGGPAVSRSFAFTAAGTNGGVVTATFELREGAIDLGLATFTFALGASAEGVSPGAILIADNAPALPYPSTITLGGLSGVISNITVTFSNFTHSYPDDVDALLVSPSGIAVVLMSDAGAGFPVAGLNLVFDDAAAAVIPDVYQLTNGTYRPADHSASVGDFFPAPAPAAPYSTALGALHGTDANGVWSLYIVDDVARDAGGIGGWSLNVTTVGPVGSPAPALAQAGMAEPGGMAFLLKGQAGETYVIEVSPDLSNWTPLSTNTLSGSTLAVQDPQAPPPGRRFYRAVRRP